MIPAKRNILTLTAIMLLVALVCVALAACAATTTPSDDKNGENTQAEITTLTSLDEILSALGDSYSVSEKVLESAQLKYGSALAVLKSENANGTGNILVATDDNGALNVATSSLSLSANDFTARVFKSGTFTKTGDNVSYYQDDKKQEEDISGAFTKTAENGDLTVIDTAKADQKISAVFDNVTLENSGLNTQITDTDKEIFALVAGNAINEDTAVVLPSLTCNYDSATDKTEVKAVYFLDGKIITCTVSFAGDLTADGFDKDEAQNQIYKETATVATAEKDCAEYDGYSALYCKTFDSLTVEKVPSAQDLEEVITFNSWDEVFTVFGEENSYLIENKLNEILTEKLFNENNIKSLFGNTCSLEDLSNGKIEMLKWAFVLTGNNEISAIQVYAQRNAYPTANECWVKSYQFELKSNISIDTTTGKKNVVNAYENDYSILHGDLYLDFSSFSETISATSFRQIYAFYATVSTDTMSDEEKAEQQEKLNIFNLLMPYAVDEKTTYSHVSVSYSSGLNNKIKVEIYVYNENSNCYESWNFNVYRGEYVNDDISYSLLEILVENGNVECLSIANKQMLSGDIIFSLENDDITYYEINPIAQQ